MTALSRAFTAAALAYEEPLTLEISKDGTSLDLGNGLTALVIVQRETGPLPGAEHTRLLKEVILPHIVSYRDSAEVEADRHDEARASVRRAEAAMSEHMQVFNRVKSELASYKARDAELSFREGIAREHARGDQMWQRSTGEVVTLDHKHREHNAETETMIECWTCLRQSDGKFINVANSDLTNDVNRVLQPVTRVRASNWALYGAMLATLIAHLAIIAIKFGPICKLRFS